jgi:hypothetical protein
MGMFQHNSIEAATNAGSGSAKGLRLTLVILLKVTRKNSPEAWHSRQQGHVFASRHLNLNDPDLTLCD